jgi:hypothetical protein
MAKSKAKSEEQQLIDRLAAERDHWQKKADDCKQEVEDCHSQAKAHDIDIKMQQHEKDLTNSTENVALAKIRELEEKLQQCEEKIQILTPNVVHLPQLHESATYAVGVTICIVKKRSDLYNDEKIPYYLLSTSAQCFDELTNDNITDLEIQLKYFFSGFVLPQDLSGGMFIDNIEPYCDVTLQQFLNMLKRILFERDAHGEKKYKDLYNKLGFYLWEEVNSRNGKPNPQDTKRQWKKKYNNFIIRTIQNFDKRMEKRRLSNEINDSKFEVIKRENLMLD